MRKFGGFTVGVFLFLLGFIAQPATAATMPAGAINVMTKGAKGDGITNDTAAIRRAISAVAKNGTVWMPAGKYLVDVTETKTIKMKSNMIFAMDPNAIIIVKPNALKRYYVLDLLHVNNVEIYGGQIIGDRDKHLGIKGEWGYGIHMVGGSNHSVHDMKISNMWGDGICIGGYSNEVKIQRVLLTNNRRQGLSITTATNVKVLDSELSYTNGTPPSYGIDIEPSGAEFGDYSRNILIRNNYIHHNQGGAIQAYKRAMDVYIRNNRIAYNSYGIYTIGALGGEISGNRFAHNVFEALALKGVTADYKIFNNLFVNNSTDTVGLFAPDNNPIETIYGMNTTTAPHILPGPKITNIEITTNRYQQ